VNKGTFRADLYYRLATVGLRVPPLRERRDDIPLLVAHFWEQFARGGDRSPPAALVEALTGQDWPGNVRELRAAVERAVLMEDPALWFEATTGGPEGATAPAADHEADLSLGSFRAAKERAVARWEKGYVEALLAQTGGNVSLAARQAHMDRNHLRDLIRRHRGKVEDD
jgi:DNA-binding NtrC family response regulator